MIPGDYHTHTCFSDGTASPEEMVLAALAKGLPELGFSDHSYTPFDESYCIPKEKLSAYRSEINRLKKLYAGRISILCGIEQDFCSETGTEDFDYVIGSVHYLPVNGTYIPVDETPQILQDAARTHFGGDMLSLAECYFETVGRWADRGGITFVGHFDLIRKFNRDGRLFDETDPRYRAAAENAIDRLLTLGIPFEINTGAMYRGYCDAPYPAPEWIRSIASRGGRFLLSSDSHCPESLCYDFAGWTALIG